MQRCIYNSVIIHSEQLFIGEYSKEIGSIWNQFAISIWNPGKPYANDARRGTIADKLVRQKKIEKVLNEKNIQNRIG